MSSFVEYKKVLGTNLELKKYNQPRTLTQTWNRNRNVTELKTWTITELKPEVEL